MLLYVVYSFFTSFPVDYCLCSHSFFSFLPQRKYIEAWEAEKIKIHINPDTPEVLLSKANAYNISRVCLVWFYLIHYFYFLSVNVSVVGTIILIFITDLFPILFQKLYREGVEEIFRKGYDLRADAVSVVAAKHGRNIISNVCNLHLNAFLFYFGVCFCPSL